jgi:uncharacterized protein (TIGR02118 family)
VRLRAMLLERGDASRIRATSSSPEGGYSTGSRGEDRHGQGSRAVRPPEDPDAFEAYYADTHTALATAIPGLKRFEAARGVATPDGSELPYQRVAELTFDDMDALQAGLGSDEGQAAVNDIPNFATGGVTIFFAAID